MYEAYQFTLADLNKDGRLDLIVPKYFYNVVTVCLGKNDGGFENGVDYWSYEDSPISAAVGDFNGDNVKDIAVANIYGNNVSIMLGYKVKYLLDDPPDSGFRNFIVVGRLSNDNDVDYFTFSANEGDVILIACETPDSNISSGLLYQLIDSGGYTISYLYANYRGRSQSNPEIIPATGTYFVKVMPSYNYYGEYRLSVILARQPITLETEDNELTSANQISFPTNIYRLTGKAGGFIHVFDYNGDFYSLGYLAKDTKVSISYVKPRISLLNGIVELYNSNGERMAYSEQGQTNLLYVVPENGEGNYYFCIKAGNTANLRGYLIFDNWDCSVEIGQVPISSQWSVEAWIKPYVQTLSGRKTIAGNAANCRDWGITVHEGYYGILVRPPEGCTTTYKSDTPVILNQWTHLIGICDGTNDFLYVNGELKASGPVSLSYNAYNQFRICGESCCWDNAFRGAIDNVRLWNRPIKQLEILEFSTNRYPQIAKDEDGLIGYWTFDEAGGYIAYHYSINERNGRVYSSPRIREINGRPAIGLSAQYIINIEIEDESHPYFVNDTLPANGSITSDLISVFQIQFSEE